MILVYNLKIYPHHFIDIISDKKKVEIRNEDKYKFKEGDYLYLHEYDEFYTGYYTIVEVTHCLRGMPYVPKGYVAMSIIQVKEEEVKWAK